MLDKLSRPKKMGIYGISSYTCIALKLDLISPLTAVSKDLHPSALVYANLHYLEIYALPLISNLLCMSEASHKHDRIVKSKPWTRDHDALHFHDRCIHSRGHPSSLV